MKDDSQKVRVTLRVSDVLLYFGIMHLVPNSVCLLLTRYSFGYDYNSTKREKCTCVTSIHSMVPFVPCTRMCLRTMIYN